jgi:hypothetical protein
MPKFRIGCYNASSGVVITFAWDDEDEYLRSKAFLQKLVGGPAGQSNPEDPESYYSKMTNSVTPFMHSSAR